MLGGKGGKGLEVLGGKDLEQLVQHVALEVSDLCK